MATPDRLRAALSRAAAVLRPAPVRPAIGAGVRTAVAATAPLAAGQLLDAPGALWAAVAAFLVSLTDKGGAYRTRARTMGATTLLAALGTSLAALLPQHPLVTVGATLLWITAAGLSHTWGDAAASVGTVSAVTFVVSLAQPAPELGAAAARAGSVLAGGGWAMLLSLVLWPVRVYRPARLAVGAAYRALAEYAADISGLTRAHDAAAWQALLRREHLRIRQVLEEARRVLAAIRRGRAGESGRGERLLVLAESADRMFANLVALADVLEVEGPTRTEAREGVAQALSALSAAAREIAERVESEVDPASRPPGERGALAEGAPYRAPAGAPPALAVAERLLARLAGYARSALETAASLNRERPPPSAPGWAEPGSEPRPAPLARLRANLSRDSLVLQHAVRAGLTAAAAAGLAHALRFPHGHWITITAVVVLQPYMGATVQRGIQRVAGTVLGAAVAAALAALVHDPRAILLLVFAFSGASVAFLPLNYAVFALFLTPAFVLLAEMTSGNWELAGVRTVSTLIGGGLALAAIRLLWPSPERLRLPEHLAAALRMARLYVLHATAPFESREEHPYGEMGDLRRAFGLAANNADASLQRLLSETSGPETEAYMTLLTYARRLVVATLTLASCRSAGPSPADAALARFGQDAAGILKDLSRALLEKRAPAPLFEPYPVQTDDPLLAENLARVTRRLAVLHGGVERLAALRARGGAAGDPE